jgi:regulator of replication initiation timing
MFKSISLKTCLPAVLVLFLYIPNMTAQSRVNYSIRNLEQEMARMARKVDSLQDSVASYTGKLNTMKRDINSLRDENKRLRLQLLAMQRTLQAERIANRKSMQKVISTVAGQVSAAQNRSTPSPAQPRTRTNTRRVNPTGSGDFYKYTVQPGSNLSIIAKAYKVKVSDIMKANKLKSANKIRAGQILYIPKK